MLPWRYCIRTSFEELNIFSAATRGHRKSRKPPGLTARSWKGGRKLTTKATRLAGMDVAVALRHSPSRSNTFKRSKHGLSLDSIVQDVVDVLKLHGASINNGVQPDAGHQSFLKLLFSPQFEKLLVSALDRELGSCFDSIRRSAPLPRHIAVAAAAADAAGDATRLHIDYYEYGSLMLRRFDRLLTPQALAKLPRDMLQSIYLLMIGLVLTTSLMLTSANSPLLPLSPSAPPPTGGGISGGGPGIVDERDAMWLAMHQHVSEMTMHYVILLGARINARIPAHYHEALITQGARAWTESERRLGVDFILGWPPGASPPETKDAVASGRVIEAAEIPCGSSHERNVGHAHAPPALESSQLPHRPNPSCC